MYGIIADSGLLVEVDVAGGVRPIGDTGHEQIDDLEFAMDGHLLAVDSHRRELLEIDVVTGMATAIGSTAHALNSIGTVSF